MLCLAIEFARAGRALRMEAAAVKNQRTWGGWVLGPRMGQGGQLGEKMKITRRGAFYALILTDVVVFVVAAFAANLMTGPLQLSWPAYIAIALIVAVLYGVVRWAFLKPERIRLLATQSLANSLADAAEAYGTVEMYNMQRREDQDRRNAHTQLSIDKAQTMRLAANSGASYLSVGLNRHWPNVRLRLVDRVPFRVVLLDPFSQEKELRNRINVAGEIEDSKLPLGDIIRASNQFPNLDVRFVNAGMSCTVFMTSDEAYFDPYHLAPDGGRIANLFMCLKIRKAQPLQGLSNFEVLSRHFEVLWEEATPLGRWVDRYRDALPPLPQLERTG